MGGPTGDALPTSHHVRMHRVIFYVSNTRRKLMIRAFGFVFRQVCQLRVARRKIIEVKK